MDRSAGYGYFQRVRKLMVSAVVGLLVCVLTAACSLLPEPRSEVCADWIHFETPQDQFKNATLVFVGTPGDTDGETSIYGYQAKIHLVDVESVYKGDPEPGPLRIASMPLTCTGGISYPEGDPLDGHRRMLIYATRQNGYWFTMTPAQGAVPFEQGEKLPFSTG